MDAFKASNNVRVKIDRFGLKAFSDGSAGAADVLVLSNALVEGIRQFFRAEEDERLGRWRWPKSPGWVVYPGRDRQVTVFDEEDPHAGAFTLGEGGDTWPYFRHAAQAYWDTHPVPKPWHEAKRGESWLVSVKGLSSPVACIVMGHPITPEFVGAGLDRNLSVTSDQITSATVLYRP